MKHTRSFPAWILLAFALAPPLAQGEDLPLGGPVPALKVIGAVNAPTLEPDAVTNQARAFFFVRLQDDSSLFLLETLDKLADELAFETVHFFAVSADSKESVERALKKDDVHTPIILAASESEFQAFGIPVFPCVIVCDGANKIRFRGTPGTFDQIRDALFDVVLSSNLAPDLPAPAKAIGKSFERWQLGEAWKALDKELAKPKLAAADQAKLSSAKDRITALTAKLIHAAASFEKKEDWPRYIIALQRLDKECAGVPGTEGVKGKLDALKQRSTAEPSFLAEYNGGIDCSKAERLERDRDWKKAHSGYSMVAKAAPDTKAGKYAASRAEILKQRAGVK